VEFGMAQNCESLRNFVESALIAAPKSCLCVGSTLQQTWVIRCVHCSKVQRFDDPVCMYRNVKHACLLVQLQQHMQ
jgi:hypothetical protein